MEILETYDNWFAFRLDREVLDFFTSHGIRSLEFGGPRWQVGDRICANSNYLLDPHIGIHTGNSLLRLGAFSYSHSDIPLRMRVGRYCSISWNVRVLGSHHDYRMVSSSEIMYREGSAFEPDISKYCSDWTYRSSPQKNDPIVGHDVWIGQDVLLAGNIVIGHGAIIAAGSVVTKDVAPYSIVGGAPAKFIKWRFDEKIIPSFLELKWWDYPLPALNRLSLQDPERFLGEMQNEIVTGRVRKMLTLGKIEDVLETLTPIPTELPPLYLVR